MTLEAAAQAAHRIPWQSTFHRWVRGGSFSQRVWLRCSAVALAAAVPWLALAAAGGVPAASLALATVTIAVVFGAIYFVLERELKPVELSLEALATYRQEGRVPDLPTDADGAAGELMAQLQETISELERMHADLRRDAETDHLTGVGNRRWFFKRAGEELSRARRTGSRFALILFDLDRFKQVNDRYGHPAGDAVLRAVGTTVRQSLRGYDCFARLGGEEFAILLPEADVTGAFVAAERLRGLISGLTIEAIGGHRTTASFGVVHLEPADQRIEDLLDRADLALYQAKEGGRDLVVPLEETPAQRMPAGPRAAERRQHPEKNSPGVAA